MVVRGAKCQVVGGVSNILFAPSPSPPPPLAQTHDSICYLAVQSSVSAKSFEQECFRLYTKLDSSEELSGGAPPIALFRIVQEPGLMIKLSFRQKAKEGSSLLNI